MYLFTVPGVLYTFLFGYTTLPYMVIAFEKFNYQDGILSPWIGIENFRFFFESNRAWEVTRNTLFLNFYFLAIGTIVAVGLAILLNEIHHQFFIRIVQSTMLFPFFLSWVIVSYILYALLSTDKGVINNMLISFGLRRISWYSEVNLWRGILVMTRTWKTSGYSMIIYLAAISGVDDSLYEAAVIDGANRWQCIWRITLPLLSPTICILILMDLGRMFYGDFGMIYALVKDSGQLLPKVDIIDTYVYRMLRVTGNPSMAMAVGLCQSLLGFVLVVGMNKIARFFFPDGALF
jgi:putative aldouronate transport system permease protein